MSSRAEGAARSRGICRALQTDFSASLREILFPLLVPGGPETASTALTSATFPCQVDFQTDHLAHFSSSLASGGHENSPTSHGLPNFVHNQNPTLRRFLKCLTIRKDVLPVPLAEGSAGSPGRFLRSLRSVEMTNGDGPDGAFTEHGLVSFLFPVAPKPLQPRSLLPCFRTRWTSRLTTSHTFSSSFASGGHRSSPSSHALPHFAHNQSSPLRRFLKCLTSRKDAHLTCHPERSREPPRLSSRAEGAARSRGICRALQVDFSAPSGRSK